ncbi:MAG: phosphoenolpyruvate carboxylase [Bacteroidota bacterium]
MSDRFRKKQREFEDHVLTKYNIYNGLFLNLPYDQSSGVGEMIPLLLKKVTQGLEEQKTPSDILTEFFHEDGGFSNEEEQINFMFKVIQFIERQVVLFDSVEDAAFPLISQNSDRMDLVDFHQGLSLEASISIAIAKLKEASARIVLTAHPTQFYQPSVLNIINELGQYIRENDIDKINQTLQQLGLTSLLNSEKPTPFDESKNILYYLRNVYYDAIGKLFSDLKDKLALENIAFENYGLAKLGFWPGGDRDGNPFVTASETMKVADELRVTLMKCYYNDVKALQKKITFKRVDKKLQGIRESFYKARFEKDDIIDYDVMLAELNGISIQLGTEFHGLFLSDFEAFVDKFKIFKNHFATLDIRQDHSVHERLMTESFKQAGWIQSSLSELSKEKVIQLLLGETSPLKKDQLEESLLRDTIENASQLPEIQRKNGRQGCERYIISNSEDIYAVLFVYALLKWTSKEDQLHFDVVPLFETMAGMNNSEEVMRTLFSIPEYREHVRSRGDVQTIMLGYSDGTKDGGCLMANWNIYRTKENLTRVCREFDIEVIFFDGRGGPPARGGGKSHRFYAAQSDLIANNEIQLTIQGQTISSTYGTEEQFIYNVKELLSASINNAVHGESNAISKQHRSVIQRLAEISYEKYKSLKAHPKFLDYLEEKSTLKYYAKANIGSRPAKRKGDKKLELSDLRAISFVGSWSQLKQNVPGYYGIGTAINELVKDGRREEVKDLFDSVPIFRALMLNSMMSLAKTNFGLTSYMKNDPKFGEFWQNLKDEYELSRNHLLDIAGYEELMQEEIFSKLSVATREKMVLPLLVIQQHALQQSQSNSAFKETYDKLITRSLYGNINASRNSA